MGIALATVYFIHRLIHQPDVEVRTKPVALLLYAVFSQVADVHLPILIYYLLEARTSGPLVSIVPLELNLKAEVSHWQFVDELFASALLVNLELHLVNLLDVINRHGNLLLGHGMRINLLFFLLIGEDVVVDRTMLFAHLMPHVQ